MLNMATSPRRETKRRPTAGNKSNDQPLKRRESAAPDYMELMSMLYEVSGCVLCLGAHVCRRHRTEQSIKSYELHCQETLPREATRGGQVPHTAPMKMGWCLRRSQSKLPNPQRMPFRTAWASLGSHAQSWPNWLHLREVELCGWVRSNPQQLGQRPRWRPHWQRQLR